VGAGAGCAGRSEDGAGLFPIYDLEQEATIIRARAAHSDVPVPSVVGVEGDPEVLGGRFLVMEPNTGRVQPDDPPYTVRGWVLELAPDDQRKLIDSAVATIAALGQVDGEGVGLGGLRRVGLDQQLGYLEQLYESGRAGVSPPVLETGLGYLEASKPSGERLTLNWGDARIGNMIFGGDLSVAGALDWEMAAIGGPEVDIAYLLWAFRLWSQGFGTPLPPGFPDRSQIHERFEELSGHPVRHLDYYERYSAVFGAILATRGANLMIGAGLLPPESPMPASNPASALLTDYLDLPAPGEEIVGWAGHR
jgi:aminoglycoside phosphotransferase (APT) family kinase protein